MAHVIRNVIIEGLWGIKTLDAAFAPDINILIGQNGSNKTTFLNLIEASLTVELRTLQSIPFKKISFILGSTTNSNEVKLSVEKAMEDEWTLVSYYLPGSTEPVTLRMFDEYEDRPFRGNMAIRERVYFLQESLNKNINMSWLSVERGSYSPEERRPSMNVVDQKLEKLLNRLVTYRQSLIEQVNKRNIELTTNVLSLLLYDPETDNFNAEYIERFSSMDPQEIQANLFRVFGQMGRAMEFKDRIKDHIQKLSDSISKVKAGERLQLGDVAPLVLINKTMKMLELSKNYKEACDKIMDPLETYQKILKKFIKDKSFSFSEEKGSLQIDWSYKDKADGHSAKLSTRNLSSGEKQLLILLTQTLLQEKQPFIYIADEPELSLHIEWQRNILGAINTINPNAQIIVATHSPEIAGLWSKSIISMESITKYEN